MADPLDPGDDVSDFEALVSFAKRVVVHLLTQLPALDLRQTPEGSGPEGPGREG